MHRISRPFRILAPILLLLAAGPATLAFNPEGNTAGPIKWNSTQLQYRFKNGSSVQKNYIKTALAAWTKKSSLTAVNGSDASSTFGLDDGINLVKFAETGNEDDAAMLCGAASISIVTTDEKNNVIDADMLIDTSGSATKARNTAMHEAGHFLGLAHSAILSAVMFPNASERADLLFALDADDQAGMDALYPSTAIPAAKKRGKITGKVTVSQNGRAVPVYGAHVVAIDYDTGLVACGALTKGVNQGSRAGTFELAGLPPGRYQIYAEPVDGPLSVSDWPGNYAGSGYWGGAFTQHYKSLYHNQGAVISVTAGGVASGKNISVPLDVADTRLNLTRVATTFPNPAFSRPPISDATAMPMNAGMNTIIRVYLYGKKNTIFDTKKGSINVSVTDRRTTAQDSRIVVKGTRIATDAASGYPYICFDLTIPSYYADIVEFPQRSHSIIVTQGSEKVMYTGGVITTIGKNNCQSWVGYE